MSTRKLSNISIAEFEAFLELAQCKFMENKKGHVKYVRSDLFRPIAFQNHIEPVPEFIILNALRPMGYTKKDFFDILLGTVIIERNNTTFEKKPAKKNIDKNPT
ncbi:MAG: type II toxin-antitoxin system HicA family toxin [Salinivirgaceae bacterium]